MSNMICHDEIEQSVVVLRATSSILCLSLNEVCRNSEEYRSIEGLVVLTENEANRLAKLL
ncbi:hypothetical protein [Vibrio atlanticus]|uniref:hypothetical protein n=1 Tax=Vibrio atlanticus TaxID=693153 RepID=UPI003D11B0F9